MIRDVWITKLWLKLEMEPPHTTPSVTSCCGWPLINASQSQDHWGLNGWMDGCVCCGLVRQWATYKASASIYIESHNAIHTGTRIVWKLFDRHVPIECVNRNSPTIMGFSQESSPTPRDAFLGFLRPHTKIAGLRRKVETRHQFHKYCRGQFSIIGAETKFFVVWESFILKFCTCTSS